MYPVWQIVPEQPPLLQQILQGRFETAKQYNEYALNFHKYHVLPACPYCNRTFNEDSLQVHQKVCPKKPKQAISQYKTENTNQIVKIPRTLVCCVCGRQFGVSSLKIHYPQCLQKFRIEEEKKAKQERRIAGVFDISQLQQVNYKQNWTYEQIKQFNENATQKFEKHTKIYCKGCNRRFMPEPYNHHLKNCQLHNIPDQKRKLETQPFKEVKMPKVLVCHICGMQFGVTSLLIHQKACKLKFINNEKLKPAGQRRALPQLSIQDSNLFNLKDSHEWIQQKIQQFNKIASQVYQKQAMHKCKICSRTFRQQAYQKHFNYCSNQQKRKQQKKQLDQRSGDAQLMKQRKESQSTKVTKKIQQNKNNICEVQELISKHDKRKQKSLLQKQKAMRQQKQQTQSKPNILEIPDIDSGKETVMILTSLPSEQKQKQQIQFTFSKNNNSLIKNLINGEKLDVIKQMQNESLTEQLLQKSTPLNQQSQKVQELMINNQEPQKIINGSLTKENTLQFDDHQPQEINQNIKSHKQIQLNEQTAQIQLISCKKCGRKFLAQRVLKHESVCKGIEKFKIVTKKPSVKKIDANKGLNQINSCQFTQEIQKDNKNQRNQLQNRGIKQNKKDIESKYQSETCIENRKEIIDEKSKNNNKINTEQYSVQATEVKQMDEEAIFQSVRCKTCNRNFRLDRIKVHERICQNTKQNNIRMRPQLPKKKENDIKNIQKTQSLGKRSNALITRQQSKQKDQMGKTKYTEMLKQIKKRRVKESDIDRQLDVQLNQFKEQKGATKQNNWNYETNKMDDICLEMKGGIDIQQDNFVGQAVVSKWKKKRRSGYVKPS